MKIKKILLRTLPKNRWGDRLYSRWLFYNNHRRFPENPPLRFNDHLFLQKTNGSHYDPLVQFVTDKEHVKKFVAATIGNKYIVKTYRILREPSEVESFVPDVIPCVIKPTQGSGPIIIYTDPSATLDKEMLRRWFKINLYLEKREQNYRYLVPKIIVEEFFSEDGITVPKDYKIFCFHGIPRFVQVDSNRFSGLTRNFYDTFWSRISMTVKYPAGEHEDMRPVLLDEMLELAHKLSAPFPFVRVDMYIAETEIRIGELTFLPGGTRQALRPEEEEFKWGAYFSEE